MRPTVLQRLPQPQPADDQTTRWALERKFQRSLPGVSSRSEIWPEARLHPGWALVDNCQQLPWEINLAAQLLPLPGRRSAGRFRRPYQARTCATLGGGGHTRCRWSRCSAAWPSPGSGAKYGTWRRSSGLKQPLYRGADSAPEPLELWLSRYGHKVKRNQLFSAHQPRPHPNAGDALTS